MKLDKKLIADAKTKLSRGKFTSEETSIVNEAIREYESIVKYCNEFESNDDYEVQRLIFQNKMKERDEVEQRLRVFNFSGSIEVKFVPTEVQLEDLYKKKRDLELKYEKELGSIDSEIERVLGLCEHVNKEGESTLVENGCLICHKEI